MDNKICIVAGIQTSPGIDINENVTRAEDLILTAINRGANIICLPELFSTPYFPQNIGLDISGYCNLVPGPLTDKFSNISKKYPVVLIIPLCEISPDGTIYNSALVIDAGGNLFPPYRKIHVPQDPCFYEKGYFHPGDDYRIYKTRYADIAVLICYDQWFPEAARMVALMGADIIFYPTALGNIRSECPGEGNWEEAWCLIQRSHSVANSVPIICVNRCSIEKNISFFGGSFICDAFGKILVQAGSCEDIIIGEIDKEYGPGIRDGWGFFQNRRPDTYRLISGSGEVGNLIINRNKPASMGYHMPAEWEAHSAVWMTWPGNELTFPLLSEVEASYQKMISELNRSEDLHLLVADEQEKNKVFERLQENGVDLSRVKFHLIKCSDVWIRDYGPTFLVNRAIKKVSAVKWEFNAWGGKYEDLVIDGSVADNIVSEIGIESFSPGIIMEGGSIDVNGRGSLLTTRSCLLNPNRNPALNQWDIEDNIRDYFGVSHIIWLNSGIAGDDTDGHIDDIARFVNPSTVLCAFEEDTRDENYQILKENYQILCNAKDQDGNLLNIITLPMPGEISDEEYRYPASYLNFYIGNKVVLVPVFGDPKDDIAIRKLKEVFSGREVIGIDARSMVLGFGTIHCATQQQPQV